MSRSTARFRDLEDEVKAKCIRAGITYGTGLRLDNSGYCYGYFNVPMTMLQEIIALVALMDLEQREPPVQQQPELQERSNTNSGLPMPDPHAEFTMEEQYIPDCECDECEHARDVLGIPRLRGQEDEEDEEEDLDDSLSENEEEDDSGDNSPTPTSERDEGPTNQVRYESTSPTRGIDF